MCAWWTGQPSYGSNPVSKYVRENFAWLKTLVDAHEVKLGPITADAGEVNILDGALVTTGELNTLDRSGRATGDLIVNGVAAWEYIAGVAAKQYLKSAGVGAKPAFGTVALADTGVAIGRTAQISASGNVTVTLTFNPSVVIFVFATNAAGSMGIGFDDGTNHYCIYHVGAASTYIQNRFSSTESIFAYDDVSNYLYGHISSKSATGFVLSFTEVGTWSTEVLYLALP